LHVPPKVFFVPPEGAEWHKREVGQLQSGVIRRQKSGRIVTKRRRVALRQRDAAAKILLRALFLPL
jgi:hypothetical protein